MVEVETFLRSPRADSSYLNPLLDTGGAADAINRHSPAPGERASQLKDFNTTTVRSMATALVALDAGVRLRMVCVQNSFLGRL